LVAEAIEKAIATNLGSLSAVWPEVILAATILVIVTVDLFLTGRKRGPLTVITLAGLLAGVIVTAGLYGEPSRSLFMGMVALDPFGLFFKLLFLAATAAVVLFSLQSPDIEESRVGEFYAILLTAGLGGFLMVSATNLLMMYLSLELVSVPSYILAGYQKRLRRSSEAALKYVIFGGVSSGIMLYGFSLIYGLTGTLDIHGISSALTQTTPYGLTLFLGTLLALGGFGYKIASVPFHFWCPDVYEGAPTPVTAFLSVAPKAAGFAMMARFFYTGFSTYDGVSGIATGVAWTELLAVVSVCTMTLGNLTAIWQTNLKRLLAYSSIAHAGYMLMGVVMLSSAGLKAVMFYAAAYLFMNLGAFLVVLVLAQRLSSEDIADYVGLGWRSPWIAFCMSVFLFSLTGIPPTAGFVGKVYLFSAVIEGKLYWLAMAGAVNSAVSLYYYARIIRAMYLERPQNPDRVSIPILGAVSLGVLVAGTLVLGVYWEPLAVLAEQSTMLFTPVSSGAQALLP
jgi:NADH-quinone oxidoreductase subunit N